jgi:plastocyanin
MTRRLVSLPIALTALVLGLAACGGGDDEGTTGAAGGQTLQISADPGGALKFEQTSLEANAGEVTIDFTNDSSLPHNVTVDGPGVEDEGTETVTGSSTSTTLELQAGTYTFYCSVDTHRAQGMEGQIVVK